MIGVLAGLVFGCFWGLAGSAGLRDAARRAAAGLVLCITAILVLATLIGRPEGWRLSHSFELPAYMVAVVLEVILIPLCAVTLQRRGQAGWIPAAAAVIVALHFIGLWLATGTAGFLVLTFALLTPPVFAILILRRSDPVAGNRPLAVTGLGSFAVLSLAALSGFFLH